MTVLITLTTAGADSGPFNLYSDLDGYVSAFETGVSKASLLTGYGTSLVPNGTTNIRVKSNGVCINFIDLNIPTSSTTTTTTTIFLVNCINYTISTTSATGQSYEYTDCQGILVTGGNIGGVGGYEAETFCAQDGSVQLIGSELTLASNGLCTEINIVSVDSNVVQCGAGDDTKIITSGVLLSAAVTIDTIFVVETIYSINGSCTTSLGSAFSDVTVLAGNTNGNSPGCFGGAPSFPPDITATICSQSVISHNNVVDNIVL